MSEPITLITDYASPTNVSFPWRFEDIDDATILRSIVEQGGDVHMNMLKTSARRNMQRDPEYFACA
jgi:hypothetical protein